MTIKPGLKDLLLIAAGIVVLLVLLLVVWHFRQDKDVAAQRAFQVQKIELVRQMRLDLTSASEAEKSAVMATTDEDSQAFADQARAATAAVERGRRELEELLQKGGPQTEQTLLAEFAQAFAEFQHLDKDLLDLAVQNTNLKAFALAFGPAAETLREMDAALSRLVVQSLDSASPDARQVIQLADDARIRAWQIQTLLAPHIMEESGQKMDELEALMAQEEAGVRTDLERLASLRKPGEDSDIAAASAYYAKFNGIKTQILELSRENTNVRSLTISLNQKRKVVLMCQNALAALEQAIQQEPVAGVTYGTPARPRQL